VPGTRLSRVPGAAFSSAQPVSPRAGRSHNNPTWRNTVAWSQ
jgi:hypothetical protein